MAVKKKKKANSKKLRPSTQQAWQGLAQKNAIEISEIGQMLVVLGVLTNEEVNEKGVCAALRAKLDG